MTTDAYEFEQTGRVRLFLAAHLGCKTDDLVQEDGRWDVFDDEGHRVAVDPRYVRLAELRASLTERTPIDLEALATALADKWVPAATTYGSGEGDPWPLYDAGRANQLCKADILDALRSVAGTKENA